MRRLLITLALTCAGFFVSRLSAQSSVLTVDSTVLAYFAQPDTLERMVCLVGTHYARNTVVTGFVPADADSALTTGMRIVQRRTCAEQGVPNVVGIMHSHPSGQGCFYYFPTTSVGTSDLVSALLSPYAIDAIYCRGRIVWLDKEPQERSQS